MDAIRYIVDTLLWLLTLAFVLRLLLQLVRASFRDPLADAIVRVTNWLILPLRRVLPPLGNIWQFNLKDSALVSITGLAELMRVSLVAAGSTRRPFLFFAAAMVLYLVLTSMSSALFRRLEARGQRWAGGR